ncbi:hypothetical protein HU718_004815 [Pseudomonas tensinigenes]|uniref:Restriction endonuclease type IV Mrr domain-containing protein n=1 Tax=Pseudomonas tensinigenes TaxID=2745511 RepID=A0ABX8Q063_9PSED|nr:hypothetical protein [Pseudomonas tensinigenes]QXI07020.1 hypothetical protein HU718_004815 [Pseudomonas tensinigenes]
MTAPHAAHYARPADWKQFERLSIALMSCVFGSRFDQYGREGQRQDGVDLYCRLKDGSLIAVQCKGRNENLGKKLTIAQVNQAVLDTQTFQFKIDRFFILSTSPHDASLTNRALELTAERSIVGEGSVEVWGWESLENIIRENASLQDSFYSEYKPKISLRGWILRVGLASSLAFTCFIGVHKYLAYQADAAQTNEATIEGLTEYMALNDRLIDIYSGCLSTLNKETFTFSYSFQQFCVVPVEKTLAAMEHQVQHASLRIDTAAINQLDVLLDLLKEDFRQGLIANQMVSFFEDGMVSSQKALCIPNNSDRSAEILKGLRKPAVAAMSQQLEFYFILRDFILPGLQSMQANVLIAVRHSNKRGVSDQMLSDARELSELLTERHQYRLKEPQQPFTLSAVKSMTSREITVSGDMDTTVEDARYGNVLIQSIQASFYGRHADVQELIRCGVYKKDAASIIEREEDAIKASAVRST